MKKISSYQKLKAKIKSEREQYLMDIKILIDNNDHVKTLDVKARYHFMSQQSENVLFGENKSIVGRGLAEYFSKNPDA